MFKHSFILLALSLPLLGGHWLHAQASEAQKTSESQQVFDSLYGTKVKAALATRDTADDQTLALEILEAARKATNSPALMVIMCEQAQKLASGDVKGYDVAVEALRLMAEADETKYAGSMESIIDLRRKQFGRARGDERAPVAQTLVSEIAELAAHKATANDHQGAASLYRQALVVARQFKLPEAESIRLLAEQSASRQQLEDRIAQLRTRLLQTADKVTATDLVMIHIVDLDNPKEASKFTDRCGDDQLKSRVALAAGDAGALTDVQALDLATWYRSLSAKAQGSAQWNTLMRSARYYQRFLDVHTASDVQRTGAQLALQEVSKAAEAIKPAGANAGDANAGTNKIKPVDEPKGAIVKGDPFDLSKVPSEKEFVTWARTPVPPANANRPLPIGEWVELIPTINPKKHIFSGWQMTAEGAIELPENSKGVFYIPFEILGDYQVLAHYKTTRAAGVMNHSYPTRSGFLPIGGEKQKNAPGPVEWVDVHMVSNLEKTVRLGSRAGLNQTIDVELPYGRLIQSVQGIPRDSRPFVFDVQGIGITIISLRIRMVNGEAKPMR